MMNQQLDEVRSELDQIERRISVKVGEAKARRLLDAARNSVLPLISDVASAIATADAIAGGEADDVPICLSLASDARRSIEQCIEECHHSGWPRTAATLGVMLTELQHAIARLAWRRVN